VTTTVMRALLAKLLGALLSEGVLAAKAAADPASAAARSAERLVLDLEDVSYTFTATHGAFDRYRVLPDSVRRVSRGVLGDDESAPADDPVRFVVDAASTLGLDGTTLANYVAELTATLVSDTSLARTSVPAGEVVALDHASIEGHLDGHPLFAANKGRLGFSASDCERYAPEARRPVRPVWLAVSRRLGEFRAVPSLCEESLIAAELPPDVRDRFTRVLRQADVDPGGYLLLPAHPWQVDHVVRRLWGTSVLRREIVVLGAADDHYVPTQSIRTLVNVSSPDRLQVKLPLKILNTSVYRGIPRHCSWYAPLTTHWLRGIWAADPVLSEHAVLLGEVASVTVRHPHLADAAVPYHWDETLGCIWREPVDRVLGPDERAWPLALVLHRDATGATAFAELVRRSGRPARLWLERLVSVVLRPLLRLLHTYGVTVNPHGENLMVVCDAEGLPSRLVVKDLVDDVCVTTEPVPERGWEPDGEQRVLPRKPWPVLRQYLVDALLLGVWAPLADLLDDTGTEVTGTDLWALTRQEVQAYAAAHPGQTDRLDATGLLGPRFSRYPLNGYRLRLGYADLVDRPPVPRAGTMSNPLHDPRPDALHGRLTR
jgi:siderophore synthetase component